MKALSLLAVLLLAPAAAHCQKALPPLPDSIVSAVGWIPVRRVEVPCQEPRALGCYKVAERVIEIRKDGLTRLQEWIALQHENAHVVLLDGGYRGDVESAEYLVRIFAVARVREMLASP